MEPPRNFNRSLRLFFDEYFDISFVTVGMKIQYP
jgi:hypothetical protein